MPNSVHPIGERASFNVQGEDLVGLPHSIGSAKGYQTREDHLIFIRRIFVLAPRDGAVRQNRLPTATPWPFPMSLAPSAEIS